MTVYSSKKIIKKNKMRRTELHIQQGPRGAMALLDFQFLILFFFIKFYIYIGAQYPSLAHSQGLNKIFSFGRPKYKLMKR
jgi:hypothetical protein